MSSGVKNEKTTGDFVLHLYVTLKDFANTEMSCIKYFEVLDFAEVFFRRMKT